MFVPMTGQHFGSALLVGRPHAHGDGPMFVVQAGFDNMDAEYRIFFVGTVVVVVVVLVVVVVEEEVVRFDEVEVVEVVVVEVVGFEEVVVEEVVVDTGVELEVDDIVDCGEEETILPEMVYCPRLPYAE